MGILYEVRDLGSSKTGGLECEHNLSVLARLLLNRGFNLLGMCNFRYLRVAEIAHPTTIARLIGRSAFSGIVVNQFLASRNIYSTFKQTGLRYSSSQFCHCVVGRVDVARRVRMLTRR